VASGVIGGQVLSDLIAPAAPAAPPSQGGNGTPMGNSNTESTTGVEPSGNGQGAQNHGPS